MRPARHVEIDGRRAQRGRGARQREGGDEAQAREHDPDARCDHGILLIEPAFARHDAQCTVRTRWFARAAKTVEPTRRPRPAQWRSDFAARHPMTRLLLAYAGTLVTFCVLDFVWLGFFAKGFYQAQVSAPAPAPPQLGAPPRCCTSLYPAGVVVFVVAPALDCGQPRRARSRSAPSSASSSMRPTTSRISRSSRAGRRRGSRRHRVGCAGDGRRGGGRLPPRRLAAPARSATMAGTSAHSAPCGCEPRTRDEGDGDASDAMVGMGDGGHVRPAAPAGPRRRTVLRRSRPHRRGDLSRRRAARST